jgi:monovalent cation:H+ antiporter-2, CPA2 family
VLMAALTAIASGAGLSAGALALVTGRLLLFMLALVALGLLLVPRAIRAVVALRRPETTLVASVGLCFGVAWLAQWFGYSVALGAFIAGSLVAESGHAEEVERLVGPVKDVFAAIFFVSVGMLIDPAVVARYAGPTTALTLAVILGKIASVAVGAFLTGAPPRVAIQAGMSLAQIGEFSFIIAGLGVSLGATADFLYPVAVTVSAVTTLTTPWLIRASGPFASWVDRLLPHRLQTFVSLYGGWIERIRGSAPRQGLAPLVRRRVALLLVDMAIVAAIVISASLARARLGGLLAVAFEIPPERAADLVAAAAALATLPFLLGMFRLARSIGQLLAQRAFPPRSSTGVDTAAAPRNALFVSLELGIMLIAALPLLAVTQPFVGGLPTGLIVLVGVGALLLSLWRQTTSLEGHVRAAAQAVVEVLAAQARPSLGRPGASLEQVKELLPGLGQLASIRVEPHSPVVGRSLAEIDLRSLTGATVLAIHRGDERLGVPSARDALRAGDVLALAGTEDALALAAIVLREGPATAERSSAAGLESRPAR